MIEQQQENAHSQQLKQRRTKLRSNVINISISNDNHEALRGLGKVADSFNSVVTRLLDYKKQKTEIKKR